MEGDADDGGVQVKDGEWRRRMNHELYALLGEKPIAHLVAINTLQWVGHVARMLDHNPVKKYLFNKHSDTSNRGAQPAR